MATPKQKLKAPQSKEKWYQSLWVKIVGTVGAVVLFLTLVNESFSFRNNVNTIIPTSQVVNEDKLDDIVAEASQLRIMYDRDNLDRWKRNATYSFFVKTTGKTAIIQDSIKIIGSKIIHNNIKVDEWSENRPIELLASPIVTNKYLSTKDDKATISLLFELNFYTTVSIVYEKVGSIFEIGNVVISIPYKLQDGKIHTYEQSIPIIVEVIGRH
jgi:archaellum component FlaG (FlaF/FlaG flagellin family)